MDPNILLLTYIDQGFFDNVTIRRFSGQYKRTYRVLILQCFCASIFNNHDKFYYALTKLQMMYLKLQIDEVGTISKDALRDYDLNCILYLTRCGLKLMDLDKTVGEDDYIIESQLKIASKFFQKYKEGLVTAEQTTLYMYEEIEPFWDPAPMYKELGIKLFPHHWFDLVPFENNKPVHTFPEFFAYQDLINLWNVTIEKHRETQIKEFDWNIPSTRELRYSYFSSLRTTLILGVHFFETYLFYLYYNLKSLNNFPNNRLIQRTDVRRVNDKQIIEDLLFIEFPLLVPLLSPLYLKYKETLNYRDAFVHMSAFTEDHSAISRMQRLINIDIEFVVDGLDNIINLIELIETNIDDSGILFWWEFFEKPVFANKIHIDSLFKSKNK